MAVGSFSSREASRASKASAGHGRGPQGKHGESITDVTLEGNALVITTTEKTVAVDLLPLGRIVDPIDAHRFIRH